MTAVHKFCKFCHISTMEDNIVMNEEFVHPHFVLGLSSHANSCAVFAEPAEGQLVWKSQFSSFVYTARNLSGCPCHLSAWVQWKIGHCQHHHVPWILPPHPGIWMHWWDLSATQSPSLWQTWLSGTRTKEATPRKCWSSLTVWWKC